MDAPRSKQIWLAPLLFAGLVAIFAWWCHVRLLRTLEAEVREDLLANLTASTTALDVWMTDQMNLATALATEPQIRELALRTLAAENSTTNARPFGRASRSGPEAELDRALRARVETVGYPLAQLVSTNFTIVAGTMRGRGRGPASVLDEHVTRFTELFTSGKPVIITPFKPPRRGPPGGRPDFAPPPMPGRDSAAGPDAKPGTAPEFRRGFRPGPSPDGERHAEGEHPAPSGEGPPEGGPPPGLAGNGTNRPPRGEITLMQVAAPIRDADGIVRGALALIVEPGREFTRLLAGSQSGKSGETYAFDQRGILLSQSRFDDQLHRLGLLSSPTASSVLTIRLADPGVDSPARITPDDTNNPARPLIHLIASALNGESGVTVTPSRDYRGIPIVGAWRWLPERGFGVATQIDAAEAYQPLRVLKFLFLILVLLLLLASVCLLLASFANVAWRRRVTEAELRLKQLGQYTLEERIGEGGMGVVYRARHALLRRDTAIKLLLPDRANPDAIGRFEREVCLTCRLTHPNTIQVYDYGRTPDGIFYYAMEYLRGLNLQQLVHTAGPQPEGRVVHILARICEALAEAHALGLVHRDIKPANVFLCHRGGIPDFVKVLDFGLVREIHRLDASDSRNAAANVVAGTPSFMPPEALDNPGGTDPRSDLYSLGALGYYILTGQRVFEAENFEDLVELHRHGDPIPPSLRSDNPVSPELDALLLRCLAKDPEQRPQSAAELGALLTATPLANSWTEAARVEWWTHHHAAGPGSGSASGSGTPRRVPVPSAEAALAIDLAGRQDASTVQTPAPLSPPDPPRAESVP